MMPERPHPPAETHMKARARGLPATDEQDENILAVDHHPTLFETARKFDRPNQMDNGIRCDNFCWSPAL